MLKTNEAVLPLDWNEYTARCRRFVNANPQKAAELFAHFCGADAEHEDRRADAFAYAMFETMNELRPLINGSEVKS